MYYALALLLLLVLITLIYFVNKSNNRFLKVLLYIGFPLIIVILDFCTSMPLKASSYYYSAIHAFTYDIILPLGVYGFICIVLNLIINRKPRIKLTTGLKIALFVSIVLFALAYVLGRIEMWNVELLLNDVSIQQRQNEVLIETLFAIPFDIIVSILFVYITNQFIVLFKKRKNNKDVEGKSSENLMNNK